ARWPVAPTLELGLGAAGLTGLLGAPQQLSQLAAVSLADASGRHSFRLQATSRELLPDSGASEALLQLPLRSSKSSAGYRFLDESPPSV
ncbi:unnamed protein product, partial [Polarella glacialis]